MEDNNLNELEFKEFITHISSIAPEQMLAQIPELTREQLAALITHLDQANDPQERHKTLAVIASIDKTENLETVGQALSATQFREFLSQSHQLLEKKLPPLLVGLRQDIFETSLLSMSDKQISHLKQEALSEPVQHHIISIVHTLQQSNEVLVKELNAIEHDIDIFDPSTSTHQTIHSLQERLNHSHERCTQAIALLHQTLGIVWSIGNIELINSLNTLHNSIQRILKDVISALFDLLKQKLDQVFEGLSDEEPVLEGLVKFSIWYLEDYRAIGLLPQVDAHEELTQAPPERRNELFTQVQESLNKIGLSTVQDLKERHIFSKQILEDFVKGKEI